MAFMFTTCKQAAHTTLSTDIPTFMTMHLERKTISALFQQTSSRDIISLTTSQTLIVRNTLKPFCAVLRINPGICICQCASLMSF